jgi:hypothetical protein
MVVSRYTDQRLPRKVNSHSWTLKSPLSHDEPHRTPTKPRKGLIPQTRNLTPPQMPRKPRMSTVSSSRSRSQSPSNSRHRNQREKSSRHHSTKKKERSRTRKQSPSRSRHHHRSQSRSHTRNHHSPRKSSRKSRKASRSSSRSCDSRSPTRSPRRKSPSRSPKRKQRSRSESRSKNRSKREGSRDEQQAERKKDYHKRESSEDRGGHDTNFFYDGEDDVGDELGLPKFHSNKAGDVGNVSADVLLDWKRKKPILDGTNPKIECSRKGTEPTLVTASAFNVTLDMMLVYSRRMGWRLPMTDLSGRPQIDWENIFSADTPEQIKRDCKFFIVAHAHGAFIARQLLKSKKYSTKR